VADPAEVRVPDIGDFDAVEVIEILVQPGDQVALEDPLITLESDKATMDVPAPFAGTVETVAVTVGDQVSEGDLILLLAGDNLQPAGQGPSSEAPAAPPPPPPLEPATSEFRVVVPDLGDFAEVDVIEVLVGVGDAVEVEQGLITLETDKATMDVPAPKAGTIAALLVGVGDKVSAGDGVVTLTTMPAVEAAAQLDQPASSAEAAAVAPPPAPAAPPAAPSRGTGVLTEPAVLPAIDETGFSKAHASPSVRKLARELGVDLPRVRGSGVKGRITAADVKAFVKAVLQGDVAVGGGLPALPSVDFAKFGPVEIQPLTRIQKISGPRLHASWVNLPHVTQQDEADVTELEATRQALKNKAVERGIKLTPLAFVVRACALTLQEFPQFKSSLSADGQSLVFKNYCHIGFAADTPNGLVVPVIRDADKKDIYELAQDLGSLSAAARDGQLKPGDMQGGVFTISSLGGIGGTAFTPIINAPEVAILGVSKMKTSPVYLDGAFVPRLILPLSLSYDHRVIDGAAGVRFTTHLARTLADVDRLIEAIP
jgi:pyruvate dehydrogenase E2 component (dihydrolipoamide acetyltransferase)